MILWKYGTGMTGTELVRLSYPVVLTTQRSRYLSSDQFKIDMSHVVKDLAVPADGTSTR
jgi:hypothetical protein